MNCVISETQQPRECVGVWGPTYRRSDLIALRLKRNADIRITNLLSELKRHGLLHFRGTRGGRRRSCDNSYGAPALGLENTENNYAPGAIYSIPVLTGRGRITCHKKRTRDTTKLRSPFNPGASVSSAERINGLLNHPTLFLLNPSSLGKPHAIEQLRTDMVTFHPGAAVIVESWFTSHHKNSQFSIPGYSLFRRDRQKRRGGGIAIYCRNDIQASPLVPASPGNPNMEVLWIKMEFNRQHYVLGGLYHPPKPIYSTDDLLLYLSSTLDEFNNIPENPHIILAGDFNQIPTTKILELGLQVMFAGPTHMGHPLDRIYSSMPLYNSCLAVKSLIKTKHSAVLASSSIGTSILQEEDRHKKSFRLRTPASNSALHAYLATVDWDFINQKSSAEKSFQDFYSILNDALDRFVPIRTVTVKSRDPKYMTPYIKHLLRRRNTLYHRHKYAAADALAARIGACISKANARSFNGLARGTRGLWDEVRRLGGFEGLGNESVEGVTCTSLNEHYQSISTDNSYTKPLPKLTASPSLPVVLEEYSVFRGLSTVRGSSIGPDGIPSWLLSSMAHLLSLPVTYLFQCSLTYSFVPPQWLSSCITPVPKVSRPSCESDFRPISITSVLCRLLEKHVVRRYFYPILTNPRDNDSFLDQYAFRPTGSTTSAIIALVHHLTDMLKNEPYVRLISLDFSRAFDTVRHSYLAEQLALLPIPDFLYNWTLALLSNRQHCTKYNGQISVLRAINASIIQGSGFGPSNFVVVISGLKTTDNRNRLLKYADDSYLLIPASAILSTSSELANVDAWAKTCNLRLNAAKTRELIITLPRTRLRDSPPPFPGLERVSELKILGVTISGKLGFGPHISLTCTKARQSFYALRLLTSHGLSGVRLHDVAQATTLARILYASPAWFGFANADQRTRINAIIRKMIRLGYLPADQPLLEVLCNRADQSLFTSVLHNPGHVLHDLLPPVKVTTYSLRPRSHNRVIPFANAFTRRGFIFRMIYS